MAKGLTGVELVKQNTGHVVRRLSKQLYGKNFKSVTKLKEGVWWVDGGYTQGMLVYRSANPELLYLQGTVRDYDLTVLRIAGVKYSEWMWFTDETTYGSSLSYLLVVAAYPQILKPMYKLADWGNARDVTVEEWTQHMQKRATECKNKFKVSRK